MARSAPRTARARPFAATTKVPVTRTMAEIHELLARHGAHQVVYGNDSQRGVGFVQFSLQERMFKIQLRRRVAKHREDPDQLARTQWRTLQLIIRAKLEQIAAGETTAEREFLADLMLPDGSTVGESLAGQIEHTYATGRVTSLLLPS